MIKDDKSFFAALLTFGEFRQAHEILGLDCLILRGLDGLTRVSSSPPAVDKLITRIVPDMEIAQILIDYVELTKRRAKAERWLY
jgi:hypothetical protein